MCVDKAPTKSLPWLWLRTHFKAKGLHKIIPKSWYKILPTLILLLHMHPLLPVSTDRFNELHIGSQSHPSCYSQRHHHRLYIPQYTVFSHLNFNWAHVRSITANSLAFIMFSAKHCSFVTCPSLLTLDYLLWSNFCFHVLSTGLACWIYCFGFWPLHVCWITILPVILCLIWSNTWIRS